MFIITENITKRPVLILRQIKKGELGGTVACWEFTHRVFCENKVPHMEGRHKLVVNVEKG